MSQWASGKIKRLYDGYESFCQEIGRLLGEPQSKPRVVHGEHPLMIDEFDLLWENKSREQNAQQLLTLLSNFYKAGFIIENQPDRGGFVRSYFIEDSNRAPAPLLDQNLQSIIPDPDNLRPLRLPVAPLLESLGLPRLDWVEAPEAFHFWIYPEEGTSLILISDTPEPHRRQTLLKTQALIQRRFYD